MEFLIKENSIKLQKNILKVDKSQKSKEYLLTELDEYIYVNVKDITEEDIKKFFSSLNDFTLIYEESCIKYNKEKDCFLIQYSINHKFYKEEFYEYKVNDAFITYGCIDYSFREGELK